VNLDGRFSNSFFGQERRYLRALIALQLDDLAEFLVVYERAVAGEFFLEGFQELLEVVFFGNSLEGRQRLPTIALLDTDVDVVLLRANVLISQRIAFISEWVVGR